MNVIPPYSRSSSYEALGQDFLSSRSLTQGLDVINMEPSAPAVRTSVINSYLSNSSPQIPANVSAGSNSLINTVASDSYAVVPYGGAGALGDASNASNNTVAHQADSGAQSAEVFSPKIYSVIKNTITQALNDQLTSGQGPGPSSNVNALISEKSSSGILANSAAAQINSFVNTLVYTVQSQTNLSTIQSSPALGVQFANQTQGLGNSAQNGTMTSPNSPPNSQFGSTFQPVENSNQIDLSSGLAPTDLVSSNLTGQANLSSAQPYQASSNTEPAGGNSLPSALPNTYASNSHSLPTDAQSTSQNISNTQGWVIDRISSSVQSMIDNLVINQSQNAQMSQASVSNNTIAALDSLIQSANSLFTSMGLSTTVTASTLQTALQEIQRNLMSAPAQGQWVNIVA